MARTRRSPGRKVLKKSIAQLSFLRPSGYTRPLTMTVSRLCGAGSMAGGGKLTNCVEPLSSVKRRVVSADMQKPHTPPSACALASSNLRGWSMCVISVACMPRTWISRSLA